MFLLGITTFELEKGMESLIEARDFQKFASEYMEKLSSMGRIPEKK